MNSESSFLRAVKISVEAGKEILKIYYSQDYDFSIEKKKDNSPVTIADKTAHKIIHEELKTTGIPILSEEGKEINYDERKNWNLFWLVDPLDGTKEFLKKNDEFTVNIALIKENRPVLGIIYTPVLKELFFSFDGRSYKILLEDHDQIRSYDMKDLLKNSMELKVSCQPENYTIIASRSHQTEELKDFIEEKRKDYPLLDLISAGSSLKFCRLAEGKANLYPRIGYTMEWDTAAGHSICNGAGLSVKIYKSNKELEYNKEDLRNPFFIVG